MDPSKKNKGKPRGNTSQKKQPKKGTSLLALLFALLALFLLGTAVLGVVNVLFNLNFGLEIAENLVELPNNWIQIAALVIMGTIFLFLRWFFNLTPVRKFTQRFKFISFAIFTAFITGLVFTLMYAYTMGLGGYALAAAQTNDLESIIQMDTRNSLDASKTDILIRAVQYSSTDVAEYLVEKGVSTDLIEKSGEALIFSALRTNTRIIKLFLNEELDPTLVNSQGQTVLLALLDNPYLVETEILELTNGMIILGVDPEARNSLGKNALDLVKEMGHRRVFRFLSNL